MELACIKLIEPTINLENSLETFKKGASIPSYDLMRAVLKKLEDSLPGSQLDESFFDQKKVAKVVKNALTLKQKLQEADEECKKKKHKLEEKYCIKPELDWERKIKIYKSTKTQSIYSNFICDEYSWTRKNVINVLKKTR